MRITIKYIVISLIFSLIAACSSGNDNQHINGAQHIITITEKNQINTLSFNGIISPILIKVISSPVDGVIIGMHFNYGERVKKGQLLIQLDSPSLGKEYQQAVSSYLTAKEKYNASKSHIIGAKSLYQAGLTSRETYQGAESNLNDSYLSFLQAEQNLVTLLTNAGIDQKDIYLLRITNTAGVKKTLSMPLKALNIYATMKGIALKPLKSDSGDNTGGSESIHVGSTLKKGQIVAEIGRMMGIKISINVDEISINKIKIGDTATVTSSAFPGIQLSGIVVAVSAQANTDTIGSGGLPSFPVTVAVNHITPSERALIHVGMSAKVQIDTISPNKIIIPIQAVETVDNIDTVMLIDPATGQPKRQVVQTGSTTLDGVVIANGLKPGDKIVVRN